MRGIGGMMRCLVAGLLSVTLGLVWVGGSGVAATTQARVVESTPTPAWQVNGRVLAVKIVGDRVFVGGKFTAALGPSGERVPRRNLAAFSMRTGALLSGWQADAGAPVRVIERAGRFIVVGGSFGQVAGVTRHRLAKVRITTGEVDPTFAPKFNGSIRAIDVDADAVYVGGAFTRVNGKTRLRIAKVSRAGVLDTRFKPRADKAVLGLAKAGKTAVVFVSGEFSKINGSRRNGVGAVRARGGATTRTVFRKAARPTFGLAVNSRGTRLFGAGGTYTNAAAAWNTKSGARVWQVQAMGDIQAVEFHKGRVYIGFHDGYQGNRHTKVLVASAATGAVDPRFRPRVPGFWGVRALDVAKSGVAVGGDFKFVSGVAARGWARFRY